MCLLWSSSKITHCFDLTNGNVWAPPAAVQLVYGCLHHRSEMMLLHGRMGHLKLYADSCCMCDLSIAVTDRVSACHFSVESVFCLLSQIFRVPHWSSAFTNLLPTQKPVLLTLGRLALPCSLPHLVWPRSLLPQNMNFCRMFLHKAVSHLTVRVGEKGALQVIQ